MNVTDNFIMLILTILCMVFITKTLGMFLSIKTEKWKRLVLYICCGALGLMIIFIGDIVNLPPTVLIFISGVLFCCEGSRLSKITIALMFASIALSFNAITDNYTPVHTHSILPRTIFWGFIYLVTRRYAPPKNYELNPALWRLLLCLTLIPSGTVFSIVLLSNPYEKNTQGASLSYLVLLLIALLSNAVLMWTVTVLIKQTKLERQNILAEINGSYYESMEEQQFQIRRLKHDMTNHLQTAISLPVDEKDCYLRELIQNPVFKQTLQYCGDSTINAIISAKKDIMERHYIVFQIRADIPDTLPFAKTDICALLANVLDNAIEACCKLPEKSRKIQLDTKVQKGLFVLKSTNPYPVEDSGEKFKTTKRNIQEHGYGLKSIREVVSHYHGEMEIGITDGLCHILAYIPVNMNMP